MKIGARDICELLRVKHGGEPFETELTIGPGGGPRLDAWAMRRSWTRGGTFGYEIKVNRGDWLQDQKYEEYREYVNYFYIVCPWGVVEPQEVPHGVGLMYVTRTGSRLLTKRKPARRPVDSVAQVVLFKGLLINRFQVDENRGTNNRDYWTAWIKRKAEDQELGHRVGRRIAQKYARMESELLLAQKQVEKVEAYRAVLDELHVTSWDSPEKVAARARRRFVEGVPEYLEHKLENLRIAITKLQSGLIGEDQ